MSEAAEFASASGAGLGRMLARLRDEHKLSVADVAQRLKYGARQIEALESEEFDKLPGATFVRGMVRSYAKLLDVDPGPLLEALERSYAPDEVDLDLRNKGVPFAPSSRRGTWMYLALSVLALVVVGGVLYEWRVGAFPWMQPGRVAAPAPPVAVGPAEPAPAEAPAAAPSAAPVVAAPEPPPPAEARIQLQFGSQSWVEIREENGRTLMSQLHAPGSRSVVIGRPPLSLVIGNAADVRLVYNDKPIDLKPYINIEVARLTLK